VENQRMSRKGGRMAETGIEDISQKWELVEI
jgi:hypothetical protein